MKKGIVLTVMAALLVGGLFAEKVPQINERTQAPAYTPNRTAYLDEGFEGGAIPTGWTNEYVSGTTDWAYQAGGLYGNPSSAHTGSFNAYFDGSTGNSTKLVTPSIDLGTATNIALTFWHAQTVWAGDQDELRVYYKDSAAGTWTLLAEYLGDTPVWTEEILTLPNPSSDYYIAFEGLDGWGYGVCLDDVLVGDPPLTIYDVQYTTDPSGNSPYLDSTVTVSGIVIATDNSSKHFIQDGDGAWNGIYVYDSGNTYTIGDEISITAEVNEYYNQTQLYNVDTVIVASSGNTPPAPEVLTTFVVSSEEAYEGVLVKVMNATCVDTADSYGEWEVDDGSGPCVADDIFYGFSPTLGTAYDVAGPVAYTYSAYKIEPRDASDIVEAGTGPALDVDFEAGLPADWIQDTGDDFDWTWDADGTTSSGTGPSGDHTTGSGYYMYTESSANYLHTANLLTPSLNVGAMGAPNLVFWYHMYGAAMGTLNIDVSEDGGTNWTNAWSESGDHGDVWLMGSVSLSGYTSPLVIRFQGVTGSSYTSDMAIDDVWVGDMAYPPSPTTPVYPPDLATQAPVDGSLTWNGAIGADGYVLYFGTDGGGVTDPTNIEDGLDVGDVTSYAYTGLAGATTHYWKVVPYNSYGSATGCDIWEFETVDITAGCVIGNGTTPWEFPFYTYYMDARLQTIYLASEFPAGYTITSLQLDVSTLPGQILENWYIRMKETTATTVTAFDNADLVTVLTAANVDVTTTGWVEFVFDTPFTYTGINNLLVDFCFDNSGYTSNGATLAFDSGSNRSVYLYADLSTGDLLNSTGGTTSTMCDNIWFVGSIYVPAFGNLDGYVYKYGTTDPIQGAAVTFASYEDSTDASGYYNIQNALTGTYDVTCSATGYHTTIATGIDILDGQTTALDFYLEWGEIAVNPASFSVTLDPDNSLAELFNIANAGPGDLTYSCSVVFGTRRYSTVDPSQQGSPPTTENSEYSPVQAERVKHTLPPDDTWDVVYSFNLAGPGQPGIETNGQHIYTADWRAGYTTFYEYNMDGTFVQSFDIAGATQIRDMAYDGTYFYGSPASMTINIMDLENQSLVGTIPVSCSGVTGVRHISYDPGLDGGNGGFWIGNWSEFGAIDMNGNQLVASLGGPGSHYGSAYDPWTPGGPYIWVFAQTGASLSELHQFDIATQSFTGVIHDCSDAPGYNAGIAGGAATYVDQGLFVILVNFQQDPNLACAYELAVTENWLTITSNGSGTVPGNGGNVDVDILFDATGYDNETKTADIVISNDAYPAFDDVIIPVTMVVNPGVVPDYEVILTPYNPPIQIPDGGGTFDYNVQLVNNTNVHQYFYAVLLATLPNGSQYGPIDPTPYSAHLRPGRTLDVNLTQNVPGNAPTGDYTYYCLVGTNFNNIVDSSGFNFTKLPDLGQVDLTGTWDVWFDWSCTGVPAGPAPIEFLADGTISGDPGSTWSGTSGTANLGAGLCPTAVDFTFNAYFIFSNGTVYWIDVVANQTATGVMENLGSGLHDGDNSMTRTSRSVASSYQAGIDAAPGSMGGSTSDYVSIDDKPWVILNTGLNEEWIGYYSAVGVEMRNYDLWTADGIYREDGTLVYGTLSSSDEISLPESFALYQNYPNPFNPTTTITFDIPEASRVTVDIYNLMGQKVRTLSSGELSAGRYKAVWSATNDQGLSVTSGVYFYRITAIDGSTGDVSFTETKKLLLMK